MKKTTEIWIDALEFADKGGWKADTQFVHLLGSSYLIAADEAGIPVKDATTKITVPETDHYRVWVRDRNWLRPYSPGKFTILIDSNETGNILGQIPSDKWLWEIAGDVELTKGEHTISAHDLTGYFGRFSSIIITNDMDYVPSREIPIFQADRARMKGLSTEEKDGGFYDVIVVGGGPGGVPAAIAAARMGTKVLLLQNRSILGGNSSAECGITMDGAEAYHMYARESGIAEEIRRLRDRDFKSWVGNYTPPMEELVSAEKNITVMYNRHVCGVEMSNASKIKGVHTFHTTDLTKEYFSGNIFLDCTGDAWLGYYAGAKYRFGREANWQHNESIANEVPDMYTMSGCLKSGGTNFFLESDEPVEYHAPEWVPELPKDDKTFGRVINKNGCNMAWWIEAHNVHDDMWDGEESRDALFLAVLGYYDHIKNYWSKKERAANVKLKFVSVFNGRREGRRLIGDYILTQNDCVGGKKFDDAISYAGWHLDIHHPEGLYSGEKGPNHCAQHVPMSQIPYRCLYSVNIDNLLFAGRNISVTHLALGCTRVANTIATLGQAAGTAAGMCVKLKELPRGIYQKYIKELQQLLIKNDQFIPGLKNEDKSDPCLNAKATASSVKKDEVFQTLQGNDGKLLPLDVIRTMNFSVQTTKGDLQDLYVKLRSENKDPTTVTMYAYTQGSGLNTFTDYGPKVTATAEVPPMWEGWVKFPIHVPIVEDKIIDRCFVALWLEPAEGIYWWQINDLSFYHKSGAIYPDGTRKTWSAKSYRFSYEKPEEKIANCGPENVVNGYSRILNAENYEWVSDPEQKLPQWIEVEFANKAKIDTVSIAFDTDLTNPGTCWHPDSKAEGVSVCVKDYNVEVFDGKEWKTVAEIRGNFQRKRNHSFDAITAEKIKVTVFATWGDPSARIMEIRASLEK